MFRARITDGTPQFPARFSDFCKDHEGRWLRIELEEPVRSLSQNSMFHAWLDHVADQTGNNAQELKEFLIHRLAPRVIATIKGKRVVEVEQIKRTSDMTKAEMTDFMDKCAALTGYPLPTEEQLIEMGYLPH